MDYYLQFEEDKRNRRESAERKLDSFREAAKFYFLQYDLEEQKRMDNLYRQRMRHLCETSKKSLLEGKDDLNISSLFRQLSLNRDAEPSVNYIRQFSNLNSKYELRNTY